MPEPAEAGRAAALVGASRLFDEAFYRRHPGVPAGREAAVRHYLAEGEAAGLAPSPAFDPGFYRALNPDVAASGVNLLAHFLRRGRGEARFGCRDALGAEADALVADGLIPPDLAGGGTSEPYGLSALEAHLGRRWREGALFLPGFEDRFYAGAYPDVRAEGAVPLAHFLRIGRAERRFGAKKALRAAMEAIRPDFDEAFYRQRGLVDPQGADALADYLLHGWRRGRDPHPGFSVSHYLRNNPDVAEKHREPLGHYLEVGRSEGRTVRRDGLKHLQAGKKPFDPGKPTYAVVAASSRAGGTPLETEIGRLLCATANLVFVVLSADAPLEPLLADCCFAIAAPADRLFLETLLEDLKKRFAVDGLVFDAVAGGAVALPALAAGVPSVALVRGSIDPSRLRGGIAAAVGAADRVVVRSEEAARVLRAEIERVFQSGALNIRIRPDGGESGTAFPAEPGPAVGAGRQEGSGAELRCLLEEAKLERRHVERVAAEIEASNTFDVAFYSAGRLRSFEERGAILDYAAKASKSLVARNPRPGFSDGAYRAAHGLEGTGAVPLHHALAGGFGKSPATHRCIVLGRMPAVAPAVAPPATRVALHIHLHYPDLASEFAARVTAALPLADVFVTVTSEAGRRAAAEAFRDNGRVAIEAVPNHGRDMLPMLGVLERHDVAARYDLFGHLHGKKSAAFGSDAGGKWRSFLLDTLAGTPALTAAVTALFAAEPALGLLFPEDRHSVGWTANELFAQALASRLEPAPRLPAFPVFPVGAMFWARPAALAPLAARLDWLTDAIPPEPLAYDGTVLHAIERLLPALAEAAGSRWATLRRPGVERLA